MYNKIVIKDSDKFYFFACYDKFDCPHYFIARDFEDLYLRFGSHFMSHFVDICRTSRVTQEHLDAIDIFLKQQS